MSQSERQRLGRGCLLLAAAAAGAMIGGCNGPQSPASQPAGLVAVPEPIQLLLPKQIRIHSFTGTRDFSDSGGIKGIDVRIEAIDGYGDAGKAFGRFRFELFAFKPTSADPKGPRIAVWTVDVADPKVNRAHWNSIMRTYQFKLGWREPIPVGQKFVLSAMFESRYSKRLFDEQVFVSGQ